MFKKKSNLPPRPKYPTNEEIIDDLTSAPNDDPLFKTAKSFSDKKTTGDTGQEKHAVYNNLKMLFSLRESLQETMERLHECDKNLKVKEIETLKYSDDLKDQAVKALL